MERTQNAIRQERHRQKIRAAGLVRAQITGTPELVGQLCEVARLARLLPSDEVDCMVKELRAIIHSPMMG